MSLALPLPNAHFIWCCAWFSIPSAIYAFLHPTTAHFASIPAAVFATSILYWSNPVHNSWERTLDIATVVLCATYQTCYAAQTIRHTSPLHFTTYTAFIAVSAACYGVSEYMMSHGRVWPATYAHATIHAVANLANIVLYDGIIVSKKDGSG